MEAESNLVFDYIVVGAGTAGGILAKQLTDDNKTSLLVLEAGTNMRTTLSNPSLEASLVLSSDNKYSFNVLSRAEQNIGRQLRLSSGRAIGGSSEHNAMYAVRGSAGLYNEWAKLVGDQWSYKKIRPLFIKNESYTGQTQSPNKRGTKGPIYVMQQMVPDGGGLNTILATASSDVLNVPIVEDYNTGIADCTFFKSQLTSKRLTEDSPALPLPLAT